MASKVPSKAAPRSRRSKAEVQQEFSEIREEAGAARESADAKAEELAKLREAEVRHAIDGVSVETVVQRVSGLGLEISKALAEISAKLVEEVQNLASVREAVGFEQKELERLHKIDVAAASLDQMVQDYAREKERLESEIAAQRAAWEEEVRTTERDRKEVEEFSKKQRQREIDDYEYKKVLERKKAQDKYDEEVRAQEKANKERQQDLEKSWKEREAALKAQEQELIRLRKESEEFPQRIQAETQKAADQAAKATKASFEQQLLLLKKDGEAEKRLADLQIKTLEESVGHQTAQIAALQKQLDEAKQQVQDIAVKAIEGASGSRALSHVNQIAMEQAKNRPQS